MRPRFSLKWLLSSFALLGITFYLVFDRPTVVAQRFVNAVNNKDYSPIKSLFSHPFQSLFTLLEGDEKHPVQVHAELVPRDWADMTHFRRRVSLEITDSVDPNFLAAGTYSVIAHINGLQVTEMKQGKHIQLFQ